MFPMNFIEAAIKSRFSLPSLPSQSIRGTFPLFQGASPSQKAAVKSDSYNGKTLFAGSESITKTDTHRLGSLDTFA